MPTLLALCAIIALMLIVVSFFTRGYAAAVAFESAPKRAVLASQLYPKTGDVVLMVMASKSILVSPLTGTYFTHGGVVVADEGEAPLLSETTYSRGARLTPLIEKICDYPGTCYIMRLNRAVSGEQAEFIRDCASALIGTPYPLPLNRLSALLPHCFQHVSMLLDVAGLHPSTGFLSDHGYLGVVRAVCNLPGTSLARGNYYHAPEKIVDDLAVVRAQ